MCLYGQSVLVTIEINKGRAVRPYKTTLTTSLYAVDVTQSISVFSSTTVYVHSNKKYNVQVFIHIKKYKTA